MVYAEGARGVGAGVYGNRKGGHIIDLECLGRQPARMTLKERCSR